MSVSGIAPNNHWILPSAFRTINLTDHYGLLIDKESLAECVGQDNGIEYLSFVFHSILSSLRGLLSSPWLPFHSVSADRGTYTSRFLAGSVPSGWCSSRSSRILDVLLGHVCTLWLSRPPFQFYEMSLQARFAECNKIKEWLSFLVIIDNGWIGDAKIVGRYRPLPT